MAGVVTGARTANRMGGSEALPQRLATAVQDVEAAKHQVMFVGSANNLWVKSPDYDYANNGKIIGMADEGILLDFKGEQTRLYDLTDEQDLFEVEAIRAWLKRGRDPRIRRFAISEREALAPKPPFVGYDKFSVEQIVSYAASIAAEMDDPDGFIEQCVKYEAATRNRAAVIEGLGGAMDQPVDDDLIEADIDLG